MHRRDRGLRRDATHYIRAIFLRDFHRGCVDTPTAGRIRHCVALERYFFADVACVPRAGLSTRRAASERLMISLSNEHMAFSLFVRISIAPGVSVFPGH